MIIMQHHRKNLVKYRRLFVPPCILCSTIMCIQQMRQTTYQYQLRIEHNVIAHERVTMYSLQKVQNK